MAKNTKLMIVNITNNMLNEMATRLRNPSRYAATGAYLDPVMLHLSRKTHQKVTRANKETFRVGQQYITVPGYSEFRAMYAKWMKTAIKGK